MTKRIIKIDQLSNRASSMAGQKQSAPQQGSMGLGDSLLNRFKFKKGMRE